MKATPHSSAQRVFLAGAGRVGTAVAALLQRSGCEVVGVASRTDSSARRAAELLSAPIFSLDGALPAADLWLIGATDDAIPTLAGQLAPRVQSGVAMHLAGSLGVRALRALEGAASGTAALHPVQACPDIDTAIARLPGSAWGVTTSEGYAEWARILVEERLGGRAHPVPEDGRVLWHAASVITSNGIAGLLAFGEAVLATVSDSTPVDVLGPLAAGTVQNARDGGGGGATLTGPIVRGETSTVERHLRALGEKSPDLAAGYAQVSRTILESARRAGRLDKATADQIAEVLAPWK